MQINLLCIGKTDDKEITSLISYYLKRLPKHWNFEIIEIPDVKNAKNLTPDLLKKKKPNYSSIILIKMIWSLFLMKKENSLPVENLHRKLTPG